MNLVILSIFKVLVFLQPSLAVPVGHRVDCSFYGLLFEIYCLTAFCFEQPMTSNRWIFFQYTVWASWMLTEGPHSCSLHVCSKSFRLIKWIYATGSMLHQHEAARTINGQMQDNWRCNCSESVTMWLLSKHYNNVDGSGRTEEEHWLLHTARSQVRFEDTILPLSFLLHCVAVFVKYTHCKCFSEDFFTWQERHDRMWENHRIAKYRRT